MAIYTNLIAREAEKHGVFRSSRLKATDVGHIYDALVMDSDDADTRKPIACDNGVALKIGLPTHDGLQTRYATIAGVKDKIAVTGDVPLVKGAFTKFQASETNFFVPAGKPIKTYQVMPEQGEVFGVGMYQFTTVIDTEKKVVALDNLVVVDGNGGWVELASTTSTATYGFVGQVYGYEYTDDGEYIVLIECLKNEDVA